MPVDLFNIKKGFKVFFRTGGCAFVSNVIQEVIQTGDNDAVELNFYGYDEDFRYLRNGRKYHNEKSFSPVDIMSVEEHVDKSEMKPGGAWGHDGDKLTWHFVGYGLKGSVVWQRADDNSVCQEPLDRKWAASWKRRPQEDKEFGYVC